MNTGPEIDMSRLENSETEASIRDETKALLQEAMSIVEMSQGTEKEEDFKREYAELAEEYNTRFEDGIIDSSDLHALKQELAEVQEWREISLVEHYMLDHIKATNEWILSGDESVLDENLTWYADVFSSDTLFSPAKIWARAYITSGEWLSDDRMVHYHGRITELQNSNESKYTKLFQLSQIIYDVSMEWNMWGGMMESAHNNATRELIKQVIGNSEQNLAVWYTQERWYYTVEWSNIDTSNDMEVGTYLCSLNKSWKLTKENLLTPNGPFSPNDLFDLINKFESWVFWGPEVQGLFIWYLDGFEDNMNAIAENYLANEQNWAHIIAFLNAQETSGNDHPLVNENNIWDIFTATEDTDISSLENEQLRQVLLQERRMIAAQALINEILWIYEWGPEIRNELTMIIEGSARWEHSMFGFTRVNEIISEYNASVWDNEKQFTLIEWDLKDTIDRTISSFDEAHMAAQSYMSTLTELENIKAQGEEKAEELQSLQAELIQAVNQVPIDQAKVEELQEQVRALRFASFYTEMQASQVEAEVEAQRRKSEESTHEVERVVSEFDRYSTLFRRESIDEVSKSQESFNLLISSVRSSSDITYLYNNHSDYFTNVHLYMLHKDVRSDLDVIRWFPNLLRKEDLHSIDSWFYQESEHIWYLIEEAVEHSQWMASKIQFILLRNYEANSEDVAASISQIQWVLQYSNLTMQQKEYVRNNIPTVLIRADEENALQIPDRPERISTISLEEFSILSVKLEDSQTLTLSERKDFDIYIGKYGLHQNKSSVINFISQWYFDWASEIQRLVNSDFISKLSDRHESSEYYQVALNSNLANIVYLNQRCRNDYLSLQIIIEKSNNEEELVKYLQYTEIGNAWDFILVFNWLTRKLWSEAAARNVIGSMPRFYSSIQSLYESESTNEEDKQTMWKILEIYALIKEGYILWSENMERALNQWHHERLVIRWWENILSEMLWRNVNEREKSIIKGILTVDEPSSLDLRNIISIFWESDEWEAQAKEFLERIASMRLDEIFAEVDRLLLEIQPAESNTEEFKNYFSNGALDRDVFIASLNQYISDTTLEKTDNENQKEYELRVRNAFISQFWLSQEQAKNISRILELESNAVNWSILLSNSETAARWERVDYQAERSKRRSNGTLYLTPWERGWSERFNYETWELEPNPNYQPPEAPENDNSQTPLPTENWWETPISNNFEYRLSWSRDNPVIESWDSVIPISEQEAELIESNPEAAKNIINMYEFFKDLNLLWVWEYREELVTAVWEVSINLEDDSLREDELLRFGRKILILVQNVEQDQAQTEWREANTINTEVSSLDSLNYQLSRFSGSRELWWDDRSFNTYWEDRFESWMRSYWIIWGITFHTNRVREMMK